MRDRMLLCFITIVTTESLVLAQKDYEKILDGDGVAYCATVDPTEVLQLNGSSEWGCVPLLARCAFECSTRPYCISFNVKGALSRCELYKDVPPLCCSVPDCVHFQVGFFKALF